jgi:acyl dehydratase
VVIALKTLIGRRYSAPPMTAEAAHMVAYALATNDQNPRYGGDEGSVAPPLFPVRLFFPLMFECVSDRDLSLDFLRLLHGEQDMTWRRPLRPGDVVDLEGVLESIAQKEKGCVVGFRMIGSVGGEPAVEGRMSLFVRGQTLPGMADGDLLGEVPGTGDGAEGATPIATKTMAVTVDELLGGDSSRLHRFAARFKKPVLPGQTLRTSIHAAGTTPEGRAAYRVQTVNADGVPVLVNGWAEIDE